MANNRADYSLADLQELIDSYLFDIDPVTNCVESSVIEGYLESIDSMLETERFFFVVDLEDFRITYTKGIAIWLGYEEKNFSLGKFVNIIHPSYRLLWSLFAKNLLLYSCSGQHKLGFLKQHFTCTLALKHQKGHYLEVKKIASVFQYDKKNRLRAYLNECTILRNSMTLTNVNPRILDNDKGYFSENEKLFGLIVQDFLSLKFFSLREIQFAEILVYSPGIKLPDIANQFNVSINTIETYSKRFLTKARQVFDNEFSSSLEAATFLANALFFKPKG